jgi:phosphatidylserine/phosphatidylglycerophosphate/cardiolipin synthase-like enzyme
MNALHSPKLLPAADYARDAAKKIAKARYRVAMIATTFRANDERSQAIVDELVRAAERGWILMMQKRKISAFRPSANAHELACFE